MKKIIGIISCDKCPYVNKEVDEDLPCEDIATCFHPDNHVPTINDSSIIDPNCPLSDDGWIPVGERLPEPIDESVEEVNVVLNQGISRDVCACLFSKDTGFYFSHGEMLQQKFRINNVIYWQPLPKLQF